MCILKGDRKMRKFKCIKSYESGEWLTKGKIILKKYLMKKLRRIRKWVNLK